ncbi:MAG: hypothetical protein WBQ25_17175 [Nitrososphaeraceae archaeon]
MYIKDVKTLVRQLDHMKYVYELCEKELKKLEKEIEAKKTCLGTKRVLKGIK